MIKTNMYVDSKYSLTCEFQTTSKQRDPIMAARVLNALGKLGIGLAVAGGVVSNALYNGNYIYRPRDLWTFWNCSRFTRAISKFSKICTFWTLASSHCSNLIFVSYRNLFYRFLFFLFKRFIFYLSRIWYYVFLLFLLYFSFSFVAILLSAVIKSILNEIYINK